MVCRVSIIIPALNEAAALGRTLRCLSILEPSAWGIRVVDGGSQDETVAIAQAASIPVLMTKQAGRSIQMNLGAATATGDVLCFLHADTLVPDDLITIIDRTLATPGVVAGGFVALMTGSTHTRWFLSSINLFKTYAAPLLFFPSQFSKGLRLLFGDQVIFCDRSIFQRCNGYDDTLPIMEDADLCLRLVQYGRIHLVNRTVQSCDRRVAKWGVMKALIIYSVIGLLWCFGVPTNNLKRIYEEIR